MRPPDFALTTETGSPAGARPSVMVFVDDPQSEAVARDVLGGNRNTAGAIRRGHVGHATKLLARERSPATLVVDISGSDLPVSEVERLADVCEPGVHLVVVGERDEIGLYRDLVKAGVSDYLVKPLTREHLRRALDPAHDVAATRLTQKQGKLIAVIGTRGGVGTTTIAVSLARHLAEQHLRRVALLDLDLQTGDCGLLLGVKPTTGLREALENPHRIDDRLLERTMIAAGSHLFVLSGQESLRDELNVAPAAIDTLLTALRSQFHYVVVEVPRHPSRAMRHVLDLAPMRLLIADETQRSVREIVRLRRMLSEGGGDSFDLLVVNRAGEHAQGHVPSGEFAQAVGMTAAVTIPLLLRKGRRAGPVTGSPVLLGGRLSRPIERIAAEVSGRPVSRPWWRRWS